MLFGEDMYLGVMLSIARVLPRVVALRVTATPKRDLGPKVFYRLYFSFNVGRQRGHRDEDFSMGRRETRDADQ